MIPPPAAGLRDPLWHHVVGRRVPARGKPGDPAVARELLQNLADLESRSGVEIHAFCLMGTHDHLLLRAPRRQLVPAMKRIGDAWEGPPRLHPIRVERHAIEATRYIHLNPVAAGLVAYAEDWPWSSYRGYLNPPEGPSWLHTRTLLARFGAIGAHERYRAFVDAGTLRATHARHGGRGRPAQDDRGSRGSPDRVPLATIARAVGAAFDCPPETIRRRRGRARATEIVMRGAFVRAVGLIGGWPPKVVAVWLGYAGSSGPAHAAARFDAAATADPRLRQRLRAALDVFGS